MPDVDRGLGETEFVAFDLETTGLSPLACRIVEVGAVRFRFDGREAAPFSELVDPECFIPREVTRIHGITNAMVCGAPTIGAVLPRLVEFLGGPETVLVAHNAMFDLGFLRCAMARCQAPLPPHRVVDTLDLSRVCLPHLPTHRLEAVARHLRIAEVEDHRGLSDARLAMHAFLRILARYPEVQTVGGLFRLTPPLGFADVGASSLEPPAGFEELAVAIQERRTIVMVYDGGSRGPVQRKVTPLGLFRSGGRPYLTAFCHLDQMEKTFRVDRIRQFAIEDPPRAV